MNAIFKSCKVKISSPDLFRSSYTVKKISRFPVPSRDVTNQTLPGREDLTYRESLVNDIPAGDGKIANIFLQCTVQPISAMMKTG